MYVGNNVSDGMLFAYPSSRAMGGATADSDPARRRTEILSAALDVLTEHGYHGASTLAIARRARTSKETLYERFGSKQGLMEATVSETAEPMLGALSAAASGDDGPAAVLRRLGVRLLSILAGSTGIAVTRAAVAQAHDAPSFGRIVSERGPLAFHDAVVGVLERLRADGLLVIDEMDVAADVFFGTLLGDLVLRRLVGQAAPPDAAAVERRAERAVGVILTLYGVPDAP